MSRVTLTAEQIAKPMRFADYLRLTDKCHTTSAESGGCWVWIGTGATYGKPTATMVQPGGCSQDMSARSAMWLAVSGALADGKVRRWCSKPLCVRPEHLEVRA